MRYHIKKRWSFFGISLVLGLGLLIVGVCLIEDGYLGYQQVQEKANPALSLENGEQYRVSQGRKGVRKEFWYPKGDQRLHAVLVSSEAELVYERDGDEQGIVEKMKEVTCLMQEELFYLEPNTPAQTVRFVRAERATYRYSTETLDADKVTIMEYTLPGHELPQHLNNQEPSKTGYAESLTLSMVDHSVKFHADKFKGSLL